MNKLKKIIISVLGGIERVFYLFTPILLVGLWVEIMPTDLNWAFWSVGYIASVFRGIEIGGWLK